MTIFEQHHLPCLLESRLSKRYQAIVMEHMTVNSTNAPKVNQPLATVYYLKEKLSSGRVEGVNNRIKTLNKVAYRYRDWEFFELKIKASHKARRGIDLPDEPEINRMKEVASSFFTQFV